MKIFNRPAERKRQVDDQECLGGVGDARANLVSASPETSPPEVAPPRPQVWRDGHEEGHEPGSRAADSAAPEKDGRRLGLYVREQRRSNGREAAYRLERRVEQAAECPFQQERDPAEQRREHPYRSHREVHVAVTDLPNAPPRGGRVSKTPVPPSAINAAPAIGNSSKNRRRRARRSPEEPGGVCRPNAQDHTNLGPNNDPGAHGAYSSGVTGQW